MFSLGIDVSKASHRCVILDNDGNPFCKPFSVLSSKDVFSNLVSKIHNLNISKDSISIGLEATGNLWENIYSFLSDNGFNVSLLNPFQTRKYHQALLKKAKTDSIDAFVITTLFRSGLASSSYVPDELIQSLRDFVRIKDRFIRDMKLYKRKALSIINLVFPELLSLVKAPFNKVTSDILIHYPTAIHIKSLKPKHILKIARSHKGNNYDLA